MDVRFRSLAVLVLSLLSPALSAQQAGSIRGVVRDKDFNVPLGGAQVTLFAEQTEQSVVTSEEGVYVFSQVAPGKYTLVFAKGGYVRQVRTEVVVTVGQLTDVDVALSGEFTEMEEFVVQDFQLGAGSEAALLQLRFDSASVMDTISSDLMSRAGASDAAAGLRLVAGASVQDGKFAVIRGLPDRYVSSQMNGVRLPTADEDKRAVELDQFPSAVIESIEVTKTFTPDQQGDASGGAVNVRLKGIPDDTSFRFKAEFKQNTNVAKAGDDFLSYDGGGVTTLGSPTGSRGPQPVGESWTGAVGVSETDEPTNYKLSMSGGHRMLMADDVVIGGFVNLFYEQDSSYFDDGENNALWVRQPGGPLVPETLQGTPEDGDFKTALLDVTQGSQSSSWGGLGTLGLETENNVLGLTYLYTHSEVDTATLAEDTRGKEYFFPGYDVNDPSGPGNTPGTRFSAPYIRTQTLEYTERTTNTIQLTGLHNIPTDDYVLDDTFKFSSPEISWSASYSSADLNQPDKRQFGSLWLPASDNPGIPGIIPPFTTDPEYFPFKPAANFNLGNLQRIYKKIDEDSWQYSADLKLPFEQWSEDEGYLKAGFFDDSVDRHFKQDTYSNFGDEGASYQGGWEDYWSNAFPDEDHPITEANTDIDYKGDQDIRAWYVMADLPLMPSVNLIGGVRFESTDISIKNMPEDEATWFPPGSNSPVNLDPDSGDADVSISQQDVLPAIAMVVRPTEKVTFRSSYTETIARPTFKELTPIIQQEFLGAPIFIGNPNLELASLKNYDLRLDYTPHTGSLFSVSWFYKKLEDPIENVQRVQPFSYTQPVNYPKGTLKGWELEVRQNLGLFREELRGFSVGSNATFIDSRVSIPEDEQDQLDLPNIQAPESSRDATGAPDHLYNFYVAYDNPGTGTAASLFYTITGETLIAGAGVAEGNYVPSVYEKSVDTLNLNISQRLGKYFRLTFQAKNLTNPDIETVYRSKYVSGGDETRTTYTRGIDLTLALSFTIGL